MKHFFKNQNFFLLCAVGVLIFILGNSIFNKCISKGGPVSSTSPGTSAGIQIQSAWYGAGAPGIATPYMIDVTQALQNVLTQINNNEAYVLSHLYGPLPPAPFGGLYDASIDSGYLFVLGKTGVLWQLRLTNNIDPALNITKTLTVNFTFNGTPQQQAICFDFHPLNFASTPPTPAAIQIKSAWYGSGSTVKNVTQALQNYVNTQPTATSLTIGQPGSGAIIQSTAPGGWQIALLGLDPAPNIRKTLNVQYSINGAASKTASCVDAQTLNLV